MWLIVILSPVGLVLGIIGLILGVIGPRAARRVGITGKGVAIAGLVLSALAIVISIAFAAGVVTVLNNDSAVDRIEQEVDKIATNSPTTWRSRSPDTDATGGAPHSLLPVAERF